VTTALANKAFALAEENNYQALAEAGLRESTVQIIAHKLGLKHFYCDPDRQQRSDLGIQQENDLRVTAFFKKLADSIVQEKIDESMRRRERFWLAKILEQNVWPTVFICGANHSLAFLDLLGKNNINATLVAQDWIV
jgi:hypothetical protein